MLATDRHKRVGCSEQRDGTRKLAFHCVADRHVACMPCRSFRRISEWMRRMRCSSCAEKVEPLTPISNRFGSPYGPAPNPSVKLYGVPSASNHRINSLDRVTLRCAALNQASSKLLTNLQSGPSSSSLRLAHSTALPVGPAERTSDSRQPKRWCRTAGSDLDWLATGCATPDGSSSWGGDAQAQMSEK